MLSDALSSALAIAALALLSLSLVVVLVAILLPAERRKALLHRLGRKWII
jgi:hypothetical protein